MPNNKLLEEQHFCVGSVISSFSPPSSLPAAFEEVEDGSSEEDHPRPERRLPASKTFFFPLFFFSPGH